MLWGFAVHEASEKGSQKGFSERVLRRAFPEGAYAPSEHDPLGVRPTQGREDLLTLFFFFSSLVPVNS